MFVFTRWCQIAKVIVLVYTNGSQKCVRISSHWSTSLPTPAFVRQLTAYFIVVLICISLVISEIEYFFIGSYWLYMFPLLWNSCFYLLPRFLLSCLSFYWLVGVLYNMHSVYQSFVNYVYCKQSSSSLHCACHLIMFLMA